MKPSTKIIETRAKIVLLQSYTTIAGILVILQGCLIILGILANPAFLTVEFGVFISLMILLANNLYQNHKIRKELKVMK